MEGNNGGSPSPPPPPPPPRPLPERPPSGQTCPRCQSVNTKFCYYNNYSVDQQRHLCKTCGRHWTLGGNIREVPVGGATRKGRGKNHDGSSKGESSRTRSPKEDQQQQAMKMQMPPTIPPTQSHYNIGDGMAGFVSRHAGGIGFPGRNMPSRVVVPAAVNPPYPGGGFFSSFASMQPPMSLNPPFNLGATQFGPPATNLSLQVAAPALAPAPAPAQFQQFAQQNEFFQIGSEHTMMHPSRASRQWTHSYINTTATVNYHNAADPNLSFRSGGAGGSSGGGNEDVNSSVWPEFHGYNNNSSQN